MTGAGRSSPDRPDVALDESAEDLYEQAPCGYLSTTPDGIIVRVNQTLLDWLGYTREALVGTRLQSLLTVGSKIYYETHYAPLLRMQGHVNEIALELIDAEARTLPVIINARQRRDAQGQPLVNRITLFDSSDRRRYERELVIARRKAEQAARDKDGLIAMLSHDIRNPLNAIMAAVHLLEAGDLADEQRRFVRLLRSSSEHMLTLLNQVLELSKAESGTFALIEASFSPRQLVDDVMATFQAAALERGLHLHADVDARMPALLIGDPVALRQVLTNLVGNAVKFTEYGSVALTVKTREVAADAVTLEFAVADTGIGIAPEVVDRIFNEFTQASYETVTKFGGTGLGLSITRKLLALYGSSVRVTSAPGEGSTFSFTLRLSRPKPTE